MSSLSDLDADVAAQMLAAIMSDGTGQPEVPPVSPEDMMKYITCNIDNVSIDVRRTLGKIAIKSVAFPQECGEGTIIDLDALPPSVLTQIYEFLKYKKEEKSAV